MLSFRKLGVFAVTLCQVKPGIPVHTVIITFIVIDSELNNVFIISTLGMHETLHFTPVTCS